MKTTCLAIALCFAAAGLAAQESQPAALSADRPADKSAAAEPFPYALDVWRDGALAAGAAGLYAAGVGLASSKSAPNAADLSASDIPFFDRLYNTGHVGWLGTAAGVGAAAAALLPAVSAWDADNSQRLTLGVMYFETLALAYSADEALKGAVKRYRPYAYGNGADVSGSDIAASFPSRHTTFAFASAAFAGTSFDATHPDSPWRAAVWGGGLALASAVGVSRVASGDHFASDVLAGAALGALIGWAVPRLHENVSPARGFSLLPTGDGFFASYRIAY